MGNKRALWFKIWPPAVVMAGLLGMWQAVVSLGWVESWMIPAPISVVQGAIEVWPRLMMHTWSTLQLTLIGFIGGSIAGFIIATLLHLIPTLRSGIYPLLIITQNVPLIVLAPVFTMLLGFGLLPKALLVIMVCFFPICIAMLGGLANTDANLYNYMRMIGSNKWRLFWRLELPNSIVHLFSGLRIAASYSVLSAIVAEWVSPKVGLGGFVILSFRGYMPDRVFAAVIIIVTISLLLFGFVVAMERLIVRWRPRKERG